MIGYAQHNLKLVRDNVLWEKNVGDLFIARKQPEQVFVQDRLRDIAPCGPSGSISPFDISPHELNEASLKKLCVNVFATGCLVGLSLFDEELDEQIVERLKGCFPSYSEPQIEQIRNKIVSKLFNTFILECLSVEDLRFNNERVEKIFYVTGVSSDGESRKIAAIPFQIVDNTDKCVSIPFYQSSGENSGQPGEWFPFLGYKDGLYIKANGTYPRFYCEQFKDASSLLATMRFENSGTSYDLTNDANVVELNKYLQSFCSEVLNAQDWIQSLSGKGSMFSGDDD